MVGGRALASPAMEQSLELARRYVTSAVDVVDIGRGQVVASARFEHERLFGIGAGLVFSRRTDNDGVVHIDVWRLVVTGFRR